MDDLSYFESRQGTLTCTAEEIYDFVTDIRNFEQFINQGTITDWQAERESCIFNVSMIGSVSFRLAEKDMYNKVVFKGEAMKKNDFSLMLNIAGDDAGSVIVKVSLSADLNPMLKMMVSKHIDQFLEILIKEMESFRGWKDIKG